MPEWLVEEGIGETRGALVENGEIVEARIELEGAVTAGTVLKGRLTSTGRNGRNAVARAADGTEYLLPGGAPGISQGASLSLEVTRTAIPGNEPWKRAFARATGAKRAAPQRLIELADRSLIIPAPADELATVGWDDLIEEARSGLVSFAGGELRISVTPAMTLIDVDGYLAAEELAVAGARQAARAIRRLDIGGSIGIDLPTTSSRSARQAAGQEIDAILPPRFERTAVNGFGFVQIIRPRSRVSLVELAQDRAMFEARALLRRIAFDAPGPKTIVGHPALIRVLEQHSAWIEAISRQLGSPACLRADPRLPMSGGYAEPA